MARISSKAKIGDNCRIAETAVVHENVELGSDCEVGEYCILGHPVAGKVSGQPLRIGRRAIIRSHTIMYEGSSFGDDLRVGHSSLVREGIVAGVNLQIGTLNDLEGDCAIGDWVRFHSNVHISRGTRVGDLVWVFPYVVTTNDPIPPSGLQVGCTLAAGSVVCTSSILLPGTHLGQGAFVGAMSRASGNVPAGALLVGNPGRVIGSVRRLVHAQTGKNHPWMTHHASAYPPEAQSRIKQILRDLEEACEQLEAKLAS
ncbi:MAG: hypothetical protein IPK75_00200 [Acidobacteria bacterium]|nr:hypothetical protein [Acidobacteriota bacterium]